MSNERIPKVLVVDDEPDIRWVLRVILTEAGFETETSEDGISALITMRSWMPDVLVCDLNMPRMSGYELLSIVRRRYPKIFVVASSASYTGSLVPTGIAADVFYAKGSARPDLLVDLIHSHLSSNFMNERQGAPIWLAVDSRSIAEQRPVSIMCPSCFRTLNVAIPYSPSRDSCPYCTALVQVEALPKLWLNGASRILVSLHQ